MARCFELFQYLLGGNAARWWPDGHWLGYEHTFVNQAADIVVALTGAEPIVPIPDFADAYGRHLGSRKNTGEAVGGHMIPVRSLTHLDATPIVDAA